MLAKGEKLPVDFTNRVIYYVGPVDPVKGEAVGPAGPTTATRMDKFTEMMLAQTGLIAMIGKAERGPVAIEAIKKHKSAYLMAVGGAAYLVSKAIKTAKVLGFADLGMEAIYEFDVVDMPVTVAVDAGGTSAHITGPAEWQKKIASGEFKNIPVAAERLNSDGWMTPPAHRRLRQRRRRPEHPQGAARRAARARTSSTSPTRGTRPTASAATTTWSSARAPSCASCIEEHADQGAGGGLQHRHRRGHPSAARASYPELPLVGVEPALKPAVARSRTGASACWPPAARWISAKFAALHDSLKDQAEFVLQPCDGLADGDRDRRQRAGRCALRQVHRARSATFGSGPGRSTPLVLGCTHYPFAAGAPARLTRAPTCADRNRRAGGAPDPAPAGSSRACCEGQAGQRASGSPTLAARHAAPLPALREPRRAAVAVDSRLDSRVGASPAPPSRPRCTFTGTSSTSPAMNSAAVDMMASRWLPPVAQVMAP